MRQKRSTGVVESIAVCYDTREQWARGQIQPQVQQFMEEDVTTFLSRARHERRGTVSPIDPPVVTPICATTISAPAFVMAMASSGVNT